MHFDAGEMVSLRFEEKNNCTFRQDELYMWRCLRLHIKLITAWKPEWKKERISLRCFWKADGRKSWKERKPLWD